MRIPHQIKISIRILLILLIIALNIIFILVFLSDSYDNYSPNNAGWIYSILIFLLIGIQGAFKKNSIIENLEKIPKENEVIISNSDQRRVIIHSALRTSFLYMLFGLFEIGLFFVIKVLTSREIGELLFFGFAFVFWGPLMEITRFYVLKKKQGYPKLTMNYTISNDQIMIKNVEEDKIINFKDIVLTELYDDMIYVKTNIEPENLIFKIKDN